MKTRFAAPAVAVAAFAVSFLRLGAIDNDHYIYVARAHQMLRGDWPVRDFVDPGFTLHYLLPAIAARIAGPTLLTDAVFWLLLFAIAVAVTFALARRASGSLLIGLAAAAVTVAFAPRLYNVSKPLVPVVAIALAWWYADQPGRWRLILLGAWAGVAVLFRFDYGVDVAAATVLLVIACHYREPATLIARLAIVAAAAMVVVLPWAVYVQLQQGVPEYLASAVRFSLAERVRTVSRWPAVYYATAAVPIAALAAGWRGTRSLRGPHVLFAATLVLLSELVLLRDVPGARLPDVCATTALLVAVAIGRWPVSSPRLERVVVATLPILIVLLAVAGGESPLARWRLVTQRLRYASPAITPRPSQYDLVRFLERCTAAGDRVLVGGFAPEIPVLAHRAFAGGLPAWVPGYYTDPVDVARARAQLARERVAAAVMVDGGDAFEKEWPAIAADLRAQGLQAYAFPLRSEALDVWLRPDGQMDRETGLPCDRPSAGGGSEDPPLP